MQQPERPEQQRPRGEVGKLKDVRDPNGHLLFRVSDCGMIQVRRGREKPQIVNIFDHISRRR